MSPSDYSVRNAHDRRQRRLLIVLALGFVVFGSAATALFYVLQPETLRIAVGPAGSDDHQVVQAMAEAFEEESRMVKLSPITTEGAAESLALLGVGKADLAIGRGDLGMPADAQTLAVLRKNYVVLWSPSGRPGKNSKKATGRIGEIADLAGRKVGIIGRTGANLALLRTILVGSGVEPDKVATVQFGTEDIEKLAQDATLDAYLAVGPLDSKITAAAIAATSRSRGAPKFLPVEASEAIALKNARYEAEEIPGSVFNAKPAWPEDKVDTISVNHLILARKELSEAKAAAFYRQLFAVRDSIAQRVAGAAHITKPETEKEAEPSVHRGAAAVINGTERTFLDKYSDYFWFALLLLSGIGSAAAWLRRYLNRDDRDDTTSHRNRILAVVSELRNAGSEQDILTSQQEVDAIIGETLKCYDDGAIEQDDLTAFGLVLELFDHAVAERRTTLQSDPADQAKSPGPTLASRR
ncbi:blr8065 [Bradyrhizobium diazoefficiens USDA 110]|uniref:Blr8065 protein n=1 Tax=Bradyrhizobium diazoefficiens (strain JCM 10833 / BCRC 13528 / IAM 13628 / NBRC 14792 / USDA 110) TaxID=224911 RepID=Q89BT3_BRADU|nr:TAXI family TRAP transporter solute-binding subunit [Bradyrhizobium diazoefficiens]AND92913.1 TRAP transporter [Bradyrhizobium diazoefficiens USDA 110]QBP26792.1 TRAP transporter substrate-binding protein [Bradyrhizobium diazoefficiens]BAC53330.1 blr8065 [Bradyrhizobium diazoefficiens USDA 110]